MTLHAVADAADAALSLRSQYVQRERRDAARQTGQSLANPHADAGFRSWVRFPTAIRSQTCRVGTTCEMKQVSAILSPVLALALAAPVCAGTLKGHIEGIEGNTLVVEQRTVELLSSTRIERADDPGVSAAGLRPGWDVEVKVDGDAAKPGTLRAKRVKVLTRPSVPMTVKGFVEKIEERSLRVDGWPIQWPDGLARDAVRLGMDLQGEGELRDDGTVRLHTWKIKERPEDRGEREFLDEVASRLRGLRHKLRAASDPALREYVARVGMRVAPDQLRQTKGALAFYVLNNPEPNAFALPDGTVVVHVGLLDLLANEAQLACVLGHEIAHVTHSHAYRSQRGGRRLGLLASVAAGVTGVLLRDDTVGRALGSLGSNLVLRAAVSGYGRNLENDADRIGLGYAVDAGYDPYQSVEVWRNLSTRIKDQSRVSNWFFGDHATHRARIANLTEELNRRYRCRVQPGALARNEADYQLVLLHHTAMVQYAKADYAGAAETLNKIVQEHPQDAAAHLYLGGVYRALEPTGRCERAIAQYKEALRVDPHLAAAQRALGLHYYELGEYEHAKSHLSAYVTLAPGDEGTFRIQGLLQASRALSQHADLMPLDQYARIVVALMQPGADMKKVLSQNKVENTATWERTNAAWTAAMSGNMDLARQYAQLYEKWRRRAGGTRTDDKD
jgi:beta-barrel assembly-enhancing protease